jgi:hypothetical protein
MKGTIMNIKFAEKSRVPRYRVALGALLYAVWRGLVRVFVPGVPIHDGRALGGSRRVWQRSVSDASPHSGQVPS